MDDDGGSTMGCFMVETAFFNILRLEDGVSDWACSGPLGFYYLYPRIGSPFNNVRSL